MSIDLDSKLNNLNSVSIDTQNVSKVAQEILTSAQKAETKKLSEQFDLSKFKRVDIGLEVYGKQISTEKATKIAIRQAGLDIQLNQSFTSNIKYLNTQAAISASSDMSKNMNGKIYAQTANQNVNIESQVNELSNTNSVFDVASLAKDKTGTNSFMNYQQQGNKDEERKEDSSLISIFA